MSERAMGSFESNNAPDILKKEKERKRVNALRRGDRKGEDSVWDLAKEEDAFRSDLTKKSIDELADQNSDKVLEIRKAKKETLEAKKAGWMDDLTGLLNRKGYFQLAPQLISMERRQQKECSFLMVDFDHFKRVNDTYGHDAGDQALKQMANVVRSTVRASDVVYRYGGEEFLVLLPGTSSLEAVRLAEKIRIKVESAVIYITDKNKNEVDLKKTVSIGCVGTDQLEEWGRFRENKVKGFLKKMVECADAALYVSKGDDRLKESGRNKVTLFHDGLRTPEDTEKK